MEELSVRGKSLCFTDLSSTYHVSSQAEQNVF